MVQKMTGPRAVTASALAGSVGVSQVTLSRWLRDAGSVRPMSSKRSSAKHMGKSGSGKRSAQEKLALLVEASKVSQDDLGEFLRREGIHEADLDRWRESSIEGLSGKVASAASASATDKRVRELEKELRRKEKALAEAGALLVLQKKVRALWEDEGNDT